MPERRRVIQTDTLEARLAKEAERLRQQAAKLKPGPARDELLRQADQAEVGAHMTEWLRPPGLQPSTR